MNHRYNRKFNSKSNSKLSSKISSISKSNYNITIKKGGRLNLINIHHFSFLGDFDLDLCLLGDPCEVLALLIFSWR